MVYEIIKSFENVWLVSCRKIDNKFKCSVTPSEKPTECIVPNINYARIYGTVATNIFKEGFDVTFSTFASCGVKKVDDSIYLHCKEE
ncbi:MAG: hypothetical protein ACE5KD_00465 [Candidatus Bathyarchaeia archaeon]